ncbi:MAG: hypothetical protein LBJ02_10095 [Bifidobacteriaceae bacterium]|jgi:hypothetical protein|nr:hypothetical protein [Bifidobacteriaceae bacterium]
MDYDEFASGEELDQKASKSFATATGLVSLGMRSYRVDGPCPRCGHRMALNGSLDLLVPSGPGKSRRPVFEALQSKDQPAPAPEPMEVPLRCACSHKHEGAPGTATGCGAEFIITIPPSRIEVRR